MGQQWNVLHWYIDDVLRVLSTRQVYNLPKWDTISPGYGKDKPEVIGSSWHQGVGAEEKRKVIGTTMYASEYISQAHKKEMITSIGQNLTYNSSTAYILLYKLMLC